MAAIAGYKARITINGIVLRAHRFSINSKVDDFDITTFENTSFGDYIPGLADADVSFDAYYDPVDNPFQSPLLINPGVGLTNVVIAYDKSVGTQRWNFPLLLVTSVTSEAGVRDVVHYSVQSKNKGLAYTHPAA